MASTEIDLGTVVVSAAVSTGVSAVVGLVVTGIRIGREARVKLRLDAMDEVHEIVGEMLSKVIKFQAGLEPGRDSETTWWKEDCMWASRVLLASRRLRWIRRKLINRQLRWLVGSLAFSLAQAQPESDPQITTGTAHSWQVNSARGATSERQAKHLSRPGALEAVLRGERDSRDVRLLKLVLRWLARSW